MIKLDNPQKITAEQMRDYLASQGWKYHTQPCVKGCCEQTFVCKLVSGALVGMILPKAETRIIWKDFGHIAKLLDKPFDELYEAVAEMAA